MGSWGDSMRKWDAEDIEKDRERKTEKPGQCVPYVSPTRACMFGFWSTDDIILQAPLIRICSSWKKQFIGCYAKFTEAAELNEETIKCTCEIADCSARRWSLWSQSSVHCSVIYCHNTWQLRYLWCSTWYTYCLQSATDTDRISFCGKHCSRCICVRET